MGLLGVKRVHLLLHQIFDILWHLSPCGVDSLTIGRFLIRIVILACAGKEIENFYLLGDVGVEKCFRVDDGGVNLQTLIGSLNAQLLVCGSAKLSLGTDEHMGWEHR